MPTIGTMSRLPTFTTPSPLPADETMGDRLQRIRKEKGVTQVDLAKRTGSSQVVVSSYECGRTHPNHEMLARIALALEVSTDYLLGIAPAPATTRAAFKSDTPALGKFQRRLDRLLHLPRRDQDAMLKVMDAMLAKGGKVAG